MRRLVLSVALLAGVGACATSAPPRIVGEAPPGVSYRFQGNDVAAATARATQYCQRYGKQAHLQTVNRAGDDNIGVFACQ
jgi:hypothetical protein